MQLIGEQECYYKIQITGRSGTGKSSLASTAPRPLVLLSERQGYNSVVDAARREGVERPAVLYMQSIKDYGQVFAALKRRDIDEPAGKPFQVTDAKGRTVYESKDWPHTVVFDSLSDALDMLWQEMLKAAPPEKGPSGLPVLTPNYWGTLISDGTAFIKAARDLPVHVVFLCLLSERTETVGGIEKTVYGPEVPTRRLAGVIQKSCNVAGVSRRFRGEDKSECFEVIFHGKESMPIKPHERLEAHEVPNVSVWIEKLKGE